MPLLNLTWEAQFRDGSTLIQYPTPTTETLFREVLDRFSDLQTFTLQHLQKEFKVVVDVQHGYVYVNDVQQDMGVSGTKNNIRLIYFRRNQVDVSVVNGKISNHKVVYFIGFQYLDDQEENHKVMLQVDQEGNILVS